MSEWIELYSAAERLGLTTWLTIAAIVWLHRRIERLEDGCGDD